MEIYCLLQIACSNSSMEALGKGVYLKNIFKVRNKDTRIKSIIVLCCILVK